MQHDSAQWPRVTMARPTLSVCLWQGKLLDLREFSLTGGGDAEEVKRAAEAEEKEERRLRAAEAKTHLRVERRLLLSAFVSLDDWASNVHGAQEKLKGVASADRLAFVSLYVRACVCVCAYVCVYAQGRCQRRSTWLGECEGCGRLPPRPSLASRCLAVTRNRLQVLTRARRV
jgi:hypothetical protein